MLTISLELLNQIFVTNLGKTSAFLRVKVDVVNEDTSSDELEVLEEGSLLTSAATAVNVQLVEVLKFEVKSNIVVLEGNEGESKTVVAAIPELEGNEEGVTTRNKGLKAGELINITNHSFITTFLTSDVGKLIPDVEPDTVVLVNRSTTDLDFNVTNESVTKASNPGDLTFEAFSVGGSELRKDNSEVRFGSQVTISENLNVMSATRLGIFEREFNNFNREVSVSSVNNLEEGNLRITSQIYILSAICDELH